MVYKESQGIQTWGVNIRYKIPPHLKRNISEDTKVWERKCCIDLHHFRFIYTNFLNPSTRKETGYSDLLPGFNSVCPG
jgi:hypothetical protein